MRIKTTRFNLLNDNEPSGLKELDPYSIYLIGIIASDDSNDHGIAICNDWIFDCKCPPRAPILQKRVGLHNMQRNGTFLVS